VRGSNVPAYGYNAVVGAVSIITKNPLEESGTHIRSTVGENNTLNINIRSNFEMTNGYGQWRFAHRENDGFDVLDDSTSVDHLVFNTTLTPNLLDSYTVELGVSEGRVGIGDGDYVYAFADDKNTSYWLSLGWLRDEGKQRWEGNFSYYDSHSVHKLPFLLSVGEGWDAEQLDRYLAGKPDVVVDYGWGLRDSQLWEAELEYQYSFSKQLRVIFTEIF
jgi:iron complex outermembrane receptor protein